MSQPPYPQHPPPYPPYGWAPPPPPRSNGWAVTALVLGICALLISWVPVVNVLSAAAGLVGLGFGVTGAVVARRRGPGTVMAWAGIVLCTLAVVVSVAVTVWFVDAFTYGELTDDDVPAATGRRGDAVRVGVFEVTVTSVGVCREAPGLSTAVSCPLRVEVVNRADQTVEFAAGRLAAVVDDSYQTVSGESVVVAPGERVAVEATVDGDDDGDVVTDVVVSASVFPDEFSGDFADDVAQSLEDGDAVLVSMDRAPGQP